MNTLKFRFASTLLTAALLGATASASFAEEPPAAAEASRSTAAVSQRAPTTPDPSASVRKLVCLNMSLQCFALRPVANSAAKTSLDLRAPEIRRIVSQAELQRPLEDEYEIEVQQEQVQVEGTRPEIYVPGGLASLPWAVMHPTQAWRIFLPVSSAK